MIKKKEDSVLIRAKILAYNRRFESVAELYKKHGYEHEAMQLFTDLRMFDDAQVINYDIPIYSLFYIIFHFDSLGSYAFNNGRNTEESNEKKS